MQHNPRPNKEHAILTGWTLRAIRNRSPHTGRNFCCCDLRESVKGAPPPRAGLEMWYLGPRLAGANAPDGS